MDWKDKLLTDEPSAEHRKSVLDAAEKAMMKTTPANSRRVFTFRMATSIGCAAGAFLLGKKLVSDQKTENDLQNSQGVAEMDENLDDSAAIAMMDIEPELLENIDWLEDIEILEQLEELEEWNES